jgi:homoaconitate hydratase
MVLESPELVTFLRNSFAKEPKILTRNTGLDASVDLVGGSLNIANETGYKILIPKVGQAAQEIIVVGGLENWVKKAMKQ